MWERGAWNGEGGTAKNRLQNEGPKSVCPIIRCSQRQTINMESSLVYAFWICGTFKYYGEVGEFETTYFGGGGGL